MNSKNKRNELYKIEKDILENGCEEYHMNVNESEIKTDHWNYVIGNRIPDKWIEF